MKKVINLFVILLIFQSCSDKLTESKVEDLINECSMKNPIYGQSILKSGKVSYLSDDDIKKYQELEKKGFLKIEEKIEKSGWFTKKYNQVTLTEKSQQFIIETISYGYTK